MKAYVIYDSVHGNTEKIAKSIGDALGEGVEVRCADGVDSSELESLDLLIVGSPTHGGRPTKPVNNLLGEVEGLDGVRVAAFDTRVPKTWVKIFGFASSKIGKKLKKKGGDLVKESEGFFVEDTEGPLREGELERAAGWARDILLETP